MLSSYSYCYNDDWLALAAHLNDLNDVESGKGGRYMVVIN